MNINANAAKAQKNVLYRQISSRLADLCKRGGAATTAELLACLLTIQSDVTTTLAQVVAEIGLPDDDQNDDPNFTRHKFLCGAPCTLRQIIDDDGVAQWLVSWCYPWTLYYDGSEGAEYFATREAALAWIAEN